MIAAFLIRLSAGITLAWILMPRRDVTDGFFRIQMRVVLGVAVLTALLLSSTDSPAENAGSAAGISSALFWLQCATAAVCFAGSICWALGRRRPGNAAILVAGIGSIASLVLSEWMLADRAAVPLHLLSGCASAAVLGTVLTGMLLGHWYLTSPTMTLRPLVWFAGAIAIAAAVRLAATAAALSGHHDVLMTTTHHIWLGLRVVGGIMAPAAAAFAVVQVLKYRNTQSATGVLFACLIMVFMGEMSAALLARDVGIPF